MAATYVFGEDGQRSEEVQNEADLILQPGGIRL